MIKRPLILITNDDGVKAQGINELTRMMRTLGDVVVVAPDSPRSGAGCSFSPITPVRLTLVNQEEGLRVYSCSGTPSDCVKLAFDIVLSETPDLVVSGINHGDNASVNIHYSGTMGAVLEGCMHGVSSIGYSLRTFDKQCNFTPYEAVIVDTARKVLQQPLPEDTCLNINFPQVSELKGARYCRQARGRWSKEWAPTEEPGVYRITGTFTPLEPDAEDTDLWAMNHGYAAIVPVTLDTTAHACIPRK